MGAETPQQDSLLLTSARTGQMIERDFYTEPEGAAVGMLERNLHLINCLGNFATMASLEALQWQDILKLRETYPGRGAAESVMKNARGKLTRLEEETEQSFNDGTGLEPAISFGLKREGVVRAVIRTMYSDFKRRYYGAQNYDAAQEYIAELSGQIDDIRTAVSTYNRLHGIRPHQGVEQGKSEDKSKRLPEGLRLLDSRERMQAILFDPRANFLPANNREKNTVMVWLDYFDNPDYPLGIGNQLLEVLVHQQKQRTHHEGVKAVESITWEIGDYLADAVNAYELMAELRKDLDWLPPGMPLKDAEDIDPEALSYLLRFNALDRYVKTAERGGLKDVLLVKEDRWINGGSDPGKHKTVHSHFTAPHARRPKATEAYLEAQAATMTVKTAKRLLGRALTNEYVRIGVHVQCLEDIKASLTGKYSASRHIATAAEESLAAVREHPIVQLILDERARQAA